MFSISDTPVPDADEQAHSNRLAQLIRAEIDSAGGCISFARYMEQCLYAPGQGYYSAGLRKFGRHGDFVTAPELGNLFARCLAQPCKAVLDELGGGDILEFGAGSGRLAVDLLSELEALDALPGRYLVLERSAELRQRQQLLLQAQLPRLAGRVEWLDRMPGNGFRGVMLGNEVLDAMAVERFRWNGREPEQVCVTAQADGFGWLTRAFADPAQREQLERIARQYSLPDGYVSEFNPALPGWVGALARTLQAGLVLLVDYGYPRHEYFHAQRSSGTLRCHYRQRAHDDLLSWPGLQDITAHVDFTAVAEAAVSAGLAVAGYTTQAHFLLDCGIDRLLRELAPDGSVGYLRQAQQAKTLMLPGEMGERFQCIALTGVLECDLPGFRLQDMRHRL